jgi:hypothetical protein
VSSSSPPPPPYPPPIPLLLHLSFLLPLLATPPMRHRPPCPEGRARQAGTHPGPGSSLTCTWRPQPRPRLLPLLKPAATGSTFEVGGARQDCAWRARPKAALASPTSGSPRMGGAGLAVEAPLCSPSFFLAGQNGDNWVDIRGRGARRSGVWRVRPKAGLAGPAPEAPRMGGAAPAPEAPLVPFFFSSRSNRWRLGRHPGPGSSPDLLRLARGRRRGSPVQHPESRIGGVTQLFRAQAPRWHDAGVGARWARYRAPMGLGGQRRLATAKGLEELDGFCAGGRGGSAGMARLRAAWTSSRAEGAR